VVECLAGMLKTLSSNPSTARGWVWGCTGPVSWGLNGYSVGPSFSLKIKAHCDLWNVTGT
jgi:hypothetical protein